MSAFAAAKLARQSTQAAPLQPIAEPEAESEVRYEDVSAIAVATEPYDGHHSERASPRSASDQDETVEPAPVKASVVQLSSYQPSSINVVQDDVIYFEFLLQTNQTATFIGEYEIALSSGIVTIYGAVLRPDSGPKRVYAPSVSALPQFQARQDNTCVKISSIHSGWRKLEKLSPLFRNIWSASSQSDRSFQLLQTSRDDALQRSLYPLEIDRDMDLVLRTLSAKSVSERGTRIMIVGGKSSGKSTFARILCNHLHSWIPAKKCLYLDLDPGQPEFGPPGQVSLVEVSAPVLGPPFTHNTSFVLDSPHLIMSHTIAATTFKDDPDHYRACVESLMKDIHDIDPRRSCPLVINTSGWTSGLGATTIAELLGELDVTDAVVMQPVDPELWRSVQSKWPLVIPHQIPRRAPKSHTRSPAESRAMQTMASFHSRFRIGNEVPRISGKLISKMRHWNVRYAGLNPGIAAVMSYNQSLSPEFLAEALDGSIVAILTIHTVDGSGSAIAQNEDRGMLQDVSKHISYTPEGIPYVEPNAMGVNWTLDPSASSFFSLALVRGVDVANKEIQLIVPMMTEQGARIFQNETHVLVRGQFDTPGWAYLEDIYRAEHDGDSALEDEERPWVSKSSRVGVESSVWRLRHPPLANATHN